MLSFQELLKNLKYFGIHNHSESSNQRLGDSTNKIPKLVEYGEQIGLKGIALTDHESLSGHVEAMDIGQQLLDRGSEFKLALGNEIYLVNSLEEVRDNYQGGGLTKFPHLILVAKNKQGHRALRELSTLAWMSSYKTAQMVRVPTTKENFARVLMKPEYKNSVIVSSACLGCEIALEFNKYKNGDSKALERIDKFISACQTVVGKNNYYLEIQPSYMQEQIEYNKFIINYGRTHNIKVIFSTDTHYLTKDHREIHKAYLNSKEGDREVDDFYASTYMMSTEEVWEYFKGYVSEEDFIQMCNNSVEIYNEIEYFNLFHPTIVPQINVPPFNTYCELGEMGKEYEYINKYYTSKHLIDKYLVFKINEGMRKLNKPLTKNYLERINEEMGYIWEISEKLESRLSSYYLLTQEVIDLCWLVSLVGIARGSATGFLLCYLLQITQMNPLEYNLPAWRHIHHSRPELPDRFCQGI